MKRKQKCSYKDKTKLTREKRYKEGQKRNYTVKIREYFGEQLTAEVRSRKRLQARRGPKETERR